MSAAVILVTRERLCGDLLELGRIGETSEGGVASLLERGANVLLRTWLKLAEMG